MADESIDRRLDRIEARLESIETELLKGDERHAELLSAIRDLHDQSFVQGGMYLALQQQIMRLQRRLQALEDRSR
jgi:chromosome segregation ATPase